MPVFATLGPAGSNHDLVTRRYLDFHRLSGATVVLTDDFATAIAMMARGEVDHVVQVAVHREATETVARAFFRHGIHVIDTFISPSHPLGILTRAEIDRPRSLGLQPATRDYVDTSRWAELIDVASTPMVATGLLEGRYDSGLTALHHADDHPGRFRVDQVIGTIDDPWIVYGREGVTGGGLVAWPDSPAAALYRRGP